MSVDPDPAELSAPRDPAAYAPRRLMGPGFWAMIALAVLCVAAGAGIATFGTHLFPPKAAPAATPPPAAREEVAPRSLAAQLAETPPAAAAPSADAGQVAELKGRVDRLEASQARTAESAAAALAAAALLEAAQTSRPFGDELTALETVSPPSAELRALRPLAAAGAPSRAALAVEFPEYAARAAGAARAGGPVTGLWGRFKAALSRVVMVRRVGETGGQGVAAQQARAAPQRDEGGLEHALRTHAAQPPRAREAIDPWLVRARTRAEIDRRVSAVRAQALEELARISRGGT